MIITTEDIVRATGGLLLNGDMGISFPRVSRDSRDIRPGDLFVALRGQRFDGHDFVLEAIEKGAKGVMVSSWPERLNIFEVHRAISIIQVEDTTKALGDLAAYVRRRFSGPVVGITGSFGKTTTKELLVKILGQRFKVAKSPGNYNNLIGLPLSILNAPPEAEVMVLELATNEPGEIARLTEIAAPSVALLVGVGPAHLEGLKDLSGVLQEKLALFHTSPEGTRCIYPFDQIEVRQALAPLSHRPLLSFGFSEGADVRATDIAYDLSGTTFILAYQGEQIQVTLPLLGRHFVHDALAAAAAALSLGLTLREISAGLAEGKTLEQRLELKQIKGHLILDDTYNANPSSLQAACEVVGHFRKSFSKAIAVVGDMKELGPDSARFHREAGALLAETFDYVLGLGEWAQELAYGARQKGEAFADKETLWQRLSQLLRSPSLILVKGSRAMRMEDIIRKLEEA